MISPSLERSRAWPPSFRRRDGIRDRPARPVGDPGLRHFRRLRPHPRGRVVQQRGRGGSAVDVGAASEERVGRVYGGLHTLNTNS